MAGEEQQQSQADDMAELRERYGFELLKGLAKYPSGLFFWGTKDNYLKSSLEAFDTLSAEEKIKLVNNQSPVTIKPGS